MDHLEPSDRLYHSFWVPLDGCCFVIHIRFNLEVVPREMAKNGHTPKIKNGSENLWMEDVLIKVEAPAQSGGLFRSNI